MAVLQIDPLLMSGPEPYIPIIAKQWMQKRDFRILFSTGFFKQGKDQ